MNAIVDLLVTLCMASGQDQITKDPPPHEIAVVESSEAAMDVWKRLGDGINKLLVDDGAATQIAFKPYADDEQILAALRTSMVSGAMLSPFRYVQIGLDGDIPPFQLVARLRRSGVKRSTNAEEPPARESYRSELIIRKEIGAWPPSLNSEGAMNDDRRPLHFYASSPYSTSGFVYPMSYLRRRGLIGLVDSPYDSPWAKPGATVARPNTPATTLEALGDLLKEEPTFDLVGAANHFVERALTEEAREKIASVYTSEPIMFDPVILLASVPENARKDIGRALTITSRRWSQKERDGFQGWTRVENGLYVRPVEVYDWVSASDDDYEGVRRASVEASPNGLVVKMAIHKNSHLVGAGEDPYLRGLKQKLMTPGKGVKAQLYLDYQTFDDGDLDAILSRLDKGDIALAELPAQKASEAIARGHGLLAIAEYMDRTPDSTEPRQRSAHEAFIIRAKGDRPNFRVDELVDEMVVCYSSSGSSAATEVALRYLRAQGKKVRAEPAFDYAEVIKSALDTQGRYGIIADYEYMRYQADYATSADPLHDSLSRLYLADPRDLEVPNTCLVVSRHFAPSFEEYKLGTRRPLSPWGQFWASVRAGVTGEDPYDARLAEGDNATRRLVEVIGNFKKTPQEGGFVGYSACNAAQYTDLAAIHSGDRSSLRLLLTCLAVVVTSSFLAVIVRMRDTGEVAGRQIHGSLPEVVKETVPLLSILMRKRSVLETLLPEREQLAAQIGQLLVLALVLEFRKELEGAKGRLVIARLTAAIEEVAGKLEQWQAELGGDSDAAQRSGPTGSAAAITLANEGLDIVQKVLQMLGALSQT